MPTQTHDEVVASRLEKLGFGRASGEVRVLAQKKRKMAVAYEHYRFVRQEKIDAFNAKLKVQTGRNMESMAYMEYQVLAFTPVGNYENVPPDEVLAQMETAVERKCFDSFEVAHIRQVKDPILFGCIAGCPDRFFIGQWDTDVKIEDILLPN